MSGVRARTGRYLVTRAFTMMSMVASDLRSIGKAGSTIGLGLLFDTHRRRRDDRRRKMGL
ncbi:hypothetical protein MUNTM_25570 [Mycobacterium sp. MUNTM1]